MSDNVKVAGIITSGFAAAICVVVGVVTGSDIAMSFAYSFGGIFGLFFGAPIAATAVRKLLGPTPK